jgi:Zn-dependent protease/predicted transcriptional regulator
LKWSYRIGQIAGTDVKVHVTFLLLVAFFAFVSYASGGIVAAFATTVMIVALFACVLLHEFGHILMARRFGVRTPDVILLPIGGLARLERMPEEPRQELLIALAGPAVTLAIAVALYLVLWLSGAQLDIRELTRVDRLPLLQALMVINVMLLLFNLIPAFPMDGGRVLRAVLASRMGMRRATRVAASVGQALAVLFGMWAVFSGNPILLLIAVFVFLAAGAEASAIETSTAGKGMVVSDMMITNFRTIPFYAPLQQAVEYLLEGEQREFPVVDNDGRVEGLLTRENLIKALAERGAGSIVGEAMTPRVAGVLPTLEFGRALEQLRGSGLSTLPVLDPAGRLIGLVTMDNISDLLLVRRAQGIE